jgi:hypothetical protein
MHDNAEVEIEQRRLDVEIPQVVQQAVAQLGHVEEVPVVAEAGVVEANPGDLCGDAADEEADEQRGQGAAGEALFHQGRI